MFFEVTAIVKKDGTLNEYQKIKTIINSDHIVRVHPPFNEFMREDVKAVIVTNDDMRIHKGFIMVTSTFAEISKILLKE